METINRGYNFESNGESINWKPTAAEEWLIEDNISFSSKITALFCLADALYVATANGAIYCVKNIGLDFAGQGQDPDTMHIVRCKIVEAD